MRVARIVAEQTKDGIRVNPDSPDVYDVVLERGPSPSGAGRGDPRGTVSQQQERRPTFLSIRERLSGVKDMAGNTYFQPDGGTTAAPRGQVQFGDGQTVITLFDGYAPWRVARRSLPPCVRRPTT